MKAGAGVDCVGKIYEYQRLQNIQELGPDKARDERQQERLRNNKKHECIYRTIIDKDKKKRKM